MVSFAGQSEKSRQRHGARRESRWRQSTLRQGFSQGRETTYAMSFTFFREAAQMAQRIAPGDYVVVQFRLRVNQRGYADICTTGIIPVARQTGAPMRDSRQLEDLPF